MEISYAWREVTHGEEIHIERSQKSYIWTGSTPKRSLHKCTRRRNVVIHGGSLTRKRVMHGIEE